MKPLLEVESDRKAYHRNANRNTVHRSSLIAPRIDGAITNISFLNHFLIKRSYEAVVLKVTAIDSFGKVSDSISLEISERKVYSVYLEGLFDEAASIGEYLIEFYCSKNLYIPFPAVMVNHIGEEFVNVVHAYNRVLNDIFENDSVNRVQVNEASIDYLIDEEHDTFFNLATGPFKLHGKIEIGLEQDGRENHTTIPVEMERLSNCNYLLPKSFSGPTATGSSGVLKILQPKQELFYGRLLSGIVNIKTKAFSANHSYYDSSLVGEYFGNAISRKAYPYFKGALNRVTMYPIMSPCMLSVHIEFHCGKVVQISDKLQLRSPSSMSISFDIDELVRNMNVVNCTAFDVVAVAIDGNIPTRVSHQLRYGARNSKSKLLTSINVSLSNDEEFTPSYKTGFTWGQLLLDEDYESYLGINYRDSAGSSDKVSIDFYDETGLIKHSEVEIAPGSAYVVRNTDFPALQGARRFIWYTAACKRPDISGKSFHYHKSSHNSSGEHSF